ncbi:NUDIX hydrolase [Exilibacterium tricleocarpae]|uniref:GDP-mannose pyrophosphatase n=1 Tax=Exilibacterium tricleocarpae TaxID=2591008 RepID=A0A545TS61_9GAMM|nr:NUDIX hydrolase [Exilibacterium tricleocarpae]TQV80053.1 NUDIX hydrolase [Exilibacterium tricleocarpae]
MTVKKIGGWRQTSATEVYDNPWIRVTHEDVITPAGTAGIYGVVHFKNLAVGVVPVDEEGFTWLVRQSRYTLDAYTWEIPEGGAPVNEDPRAAAERELAEETGLRATHWEELLRLHTSNSVTDECAVVYVARGLSQGVTCHEDTEDIEIRRLPLTEAIAMAMTGEITDALSVAALFKLGLAWKE